MRPVKTKAIKKTNGDPRESVEQAVKEEMVPLVVSMGVREELSVLYKCSGGLVGERTRRPCTERVIELQFVDDLTAVGTTRKSMRAVRSLQELLREWGLTLGVVN